MSVSYVPASAPTSKADGLPSHGPLGPRLAGGASALPREALVCACFSVGLKTLRSAERRLTSVEAIGQALKAGTNCGPCIPEL